MPSNYDARAATYDETRSASPSVVRTLLRALGPAGGRSLLDIGGGTGNYAVALGEDGFDVTIADASHEMLKRAAKKLSTARFVLGDALYLPFGDSSFDCAVSVNVSHSIDDWRGHIAEAHRVVDAGTFALLVDTHENLEAHWAFEYFPQAKGLTLKNHPPAAEVIDAMQSAGFEDVQPYGFTFEDRKDGTFEALKHWPETYLDPAYRRNTTFFQRLPLEIEKRGVERLRADFVSGALRDVIARYEPLQREVGDATVFSASVR